MIGYIMTTTTSITTGNKTFARSGSQFDIISYSYDTKVVDDGLGNKILSDLKIVVYVLLSRGAIVEVDSKIYRIIMKIAPLTGSGKYLLKEIRG